MKIQAGFTLIELLISMSIIMIVGSVMLVVFFTTIRGTEKAQQLILIRQNGNFALTQMSKTIRLTKDFDNSTCIAEEGGTEVSIGENNATVYACNAEQETISVSNNDEVEVTSLLDESAVRVTSCRFYCGYRENTNIPYVTVKFSLAPRNTGQDQEAETMDFTSTVFLRNVTN